METRVLIAPLNWGLGHATRCIPIINDLLARGIEVVLASDGRALDLLKSEFPKLKHYALPPWNISYPEKGRYFLWHMFLQSSKVFWAIRNEKKAIAHLVAKEKITHIISDNRLGALNSNTKNVVLTHQVYLQSPVFSKALNKLNHKYLAKFHACWIIDEEGEKNLSGKLSRGESLPFTHRFIGLLSRFKAAPASMDIDVLALISGPEPQRTLFEKELLPQLEKLNLNCTVLLGKPDENSSARIKGKLKVFPHMNSADIERHLQSAKVVISRTGYTTVMDLALLGKQALLIPTPGQTEQEYLGKHYQKKGWYVIQQQGKIDVAKGLAELNNTTAPKFEQSMYLAKALNDFLNDYDND